MVHGTLRLTLGRRKWLARLLDSAQPIRRGRGPVGHECMQAGWTEWAYYDPATGERIGNLAAALARCGDEAKLRDLIKGEMLTEAGHAMLAASVQGGADPASVGAATSSA